jgi:ParB family chromosome partitioning protein
MKSSAKNIRMTSFDDLFREQEDVGGERIKEALLEELYPFKNHPFKVEDDVGMKDMAESIRKYGVLVPGIVRIRPGGGYELVAGHRRRHASMLAGKETMPVIIRELDDDDAVLAMVDSNLQREDLLPSEKAWAYKMKLDAVRRKAGRPAKGNSGQVVQNSERKFSVEAVAESVGENYKQVQRYIRLTELLPALLGMVDDKKIPFNTGVELSYLSKEEQGQLLGLMGELSFIPSLDQARHLKKSSQKGELCREVMAGVLIKIERPAPVQVTIKRDRLKRFFPESYTQQQIEEVVFSLLEKWKLEQLSGKKAGPGAGTAADKGI